MQSLRYWLLLIVCLFIVPTLVFADAASTAVPMTTTVTQAVGEVRAGDTVKVPIITWGGDIATIHANGDAARTADGSFFARAGLRVELVKEDNWNRQVAMYLSGETPYLRGTLGMLNMAAEVTSRDPRTVPVVVYQMTWSTGGDCLVVKENIRTAADLRGKTIALQSYGPHVDFLGTILRDAGLSMTDVRVVWMPDLTASDNSPYKALERADVDAALMITPDGMRLTANGTVGTGVEGSIRGARILLSTRTSTNIIADVYAVRTDYFSANRALVQKFVHALILATDDLKNLRRDRQTRSADYRRMLTSGATVLMGSAQALADAEGMIGDCEFVGLAGNQRFFTDAAYPRNFQRLTGEIQTMFRQIGLLSRATAIGHAGWDYAAFSGAAVATVPTPRFDQSRVASVVEERSTRGTLGQGELFSFEIFFGPNQNTFAPEQYQDAFTRAVELSATYGGAVIVVEGHADPMEYLRKKRSGQPEDVLRRTIQAARNLSASRAMAVRDALIQFAGSRHVPLDQSQFTIVGSGISNPKTGMCGAEPCAPRDDAAWRSNMRVVFRIIQVEAESSVFTPLQ